MTAFTVRRATDTTPMFHIFDDRWAIAKVYGRHGATTDEARSMAVIFAAAPAMLAALMEAKAALEYAARGADAEMEGKLATTIAKVNAAIARASPVLEMEE